VCVCVCVCVGRHCVLALKVSEMLLLFPAKLSLSDRFKACVESVEAADKAKGVPCLYTVLKTLPENSKWFQSLQLIPKLVFFYEWLNGRLNHVFSEEQAREWSMAMLFEACTRFEEREGTRMQQLYGSMQALWNALHDDTRGDLVVGACDNVNKFFKIDLDTKVLFFLTPPDQSSDYLIKVCHLQAFSCCCVETFPSDELTLVSVCLHTPVLCLCMSSHYAVLRRC
jgi:hypothetical protein